MGPITRADRRDVLEAVRRHAELERLVSEPLDPDYEAWRSSRYRYIPRGSDILRLPVVGGSSFTTGKNVETLYANKSAGTAKNAFTTEAQINDTAGMGAQATVVAGVLWSDESQRTFTLRVVARGIISSTGTPTFTWTTRFASTSGALVGGTTTLTTLTGISNQLWEMEFDVSLVTKGAAGTNSTVRGAGLLSSPGGLASPGSYNVWGGAAQPGTVATVDCSVDNLFFFDAACGTSSASNGITLLQLIIQGMD